MDTLKLHLNGFKVVPVSGMLQPKHFGVLSARIWTAQMFDTTAHTTKPGIMLNK